MTAVRDFAAKMDRCQREAARYAERSANPRGRNIGPKSPHLGRCRHVAFVVVCDLRLAAGTTLGGWTAPVECEVSGVPLSEPIFSRGQAKKRLRVVRRRFPGAIVQQYVAIDRSKAPFPSIRPREPLPAGWWRGLPTQAAVPFLEIPRDFR